MSDYVNIEKFKSFLMSRFTKTNEWKILNQVLEKRIGGSVYTKLLHIESGIIFELNEPGDKGGTSTLTISTFDEPSGDQFTLFTEDIKNENKLSKAFAHIVKKIYAGKIGKERKDLLIKRCLGRMKEIENFEKE